MNGVFPLDRKCECGHLASVRFHGFRCGACAWADFGSLPATLFKIQVSRRRSVVPDVHRSAA